MKNIKVRYIWMTIVLLVILAFLFVYLCTITSDGLNTFMIVLLAIDFIILTILVQVASMKTFKYKPKPVVYDTLNVAGDVNSLKSNLKKAKYKERTTPAGKSYLLVYNTTALKANIIEKPEEYFKPEQEDNTKVNHDLDKCDGFVGFEIFLDIDEENKKRLVDFSIQGKNVYYTAFLYNSDTNVFECLNHVLPDEKFKSGYDKLFNDLGFSLIKEEENEEGN